MATISNSVLFCIGLHIFNKARLRPNALGQGQLVEAEAIILASRPICSRGFNITGISLLLFINVNSYFKYNTENILSDLWCYTCVDNDKGGPQSGCLHVIIQTCVRHTLSASELNLRCWQYYPFA